MRYWGFRKEVVQKYRYVVTAYNTQTKNRDIMWPGLFKNLRGALDFVKAVNKPRDKFPIEFRRLGYDGFRWTTETAQSVRIQRSAHFRLTNKQHALLNTGEHYYKYLELKWQ